MFVGYTAHRDATLSDVSLGWRWLRFRFLRFFFWRNTVPDTPEESRLRGVSCHSLHTNELCERNCARPTLIGESANGFGGKKQTHGLAIDSYPQSRHVLFSDRRTAPEALDIRRFSGLVSKRSVTIFVGLDSRCLIGTSNAHAGRLVHDSSHRSIWNV